MTKLAALSAAASRANSVPQATQALGTQLAEGFSLLGKVGTGAAGLSIVNNAFNGNWQGALYGAVDLGVHNGLSAVGESTAIQRWE